MKYVSIKPTKLKGQIQVPPSKSICHRALICSALAQGESNIKNVDFSEDIEATCSALEALGVDIKRDKHTLNVTGNSVIRMKNSNIHCFKSGSTIRFLIPIAATLGEKVTFTGEDKLIERPLDVYYDIFDKQKIFYRNFQGKLPLTINGKLKPGEYRVKGNISSQFISGLLFALPLLDGDSKIVVTTELESKSYVDITLDMLERFGVYVDKKDYREFLINGKQTYKKNNCSIEGDFSQAAFWMTAGALGDGIICSSLNMNSLQGDKAVIRILKDMGVEIEEKGDTLKVNPSETHGTYIDASQCPDLVPVLAALASVSSGTTEITNAARLRIKESDRLKAISTELNKIGADVKEREDGLIINGKERLKGGKVTSWRDHRIAMALAVVSSKCVNPMIMKEAEYVKKSYPGFWQDFRRLGGNIDEWNVGE